MSDRVYNCLKFVAMTVLPGLGTLYFTLAGIWGLPFGEQIVGSITAIDLFLGLLLGITTSQYNKQVSEQSALKNFVSSDTAKKSTTKKRTTKSEDK